MGVVALLIILSTTRENMTSAIPLTDDDLKSYVISEMDKTKKPSENVTLVLPKLNDIISKRGLVNNASGPIQSLMEIVVAYSPNYSSNAKPSIDNFYLNLYSNLNKIDGWKPNFSDNTDMNKNFIGGGYDYFFPTDPSPSPSPSPCRTKTTSIPGGYVETRCFDS